MALGLRITEFSYIKYFELLKYKLKKNLKSAPWININSSPFLLESSLDRSWVMFVPSLTSVSSVQEHKSAPSTSLVADAKDVILTAS